MKSASNVVIQPFMLFLALAFLFSCQPAHRQNNQIGEIHLSIDPAHLPPIAKLSEIAKSVRIIPLETNPNCFIGSTNKVFVGKKEMLISTAGETTELFQFTPDGRFIRKIGNRGKGPGEYTDINDMTVFEDSSVVFINGWQMRKIIGYSFDGKITREIPIPRGLTSPVVLDRNRIALISYKDYEVMIINTLSGDTAKYIQVTPKMIAQMRNLSGSPATGFFYWSIGRDTIWKIEADSMRPKIIGEFGSGHFASADYMKCVTEGLAYPSGKLSLSLGTMMGSGYYHVSLMREDDRKQYTFVHVMYQEKTKLSWHLDQSPASDDILFCTSTDFRTVASSGEWVSVVGADELIGALPKIKVNKNFRYPPGLIEQIEKMTIEDNPVVVLYTLK